MLDTLQKLYPTATKEQIIRNKKSLIQNAMDNGYADEDTPDSVAMDMRYENDPEYLDDTGEEYEDYKDEAIKELNSR